MALLASKKRTDALKKEQQKANNNAVKFAKQVLKKDIGRVTGVELAIPKGKKTKDAVIKSIGQILDYSVEEMDEQ